MKKMFSWYIKPTDLEFKKIWENAILTVDANVLLDLYRYNQKTREDILNGLESFSKRIWISRQASEEYVKNRYRAIFSISKSFNDAIEELDNLTKSFEQSLARLRSNRIVPQEITNALSETLGKDLCNIKNMLEQSKDQSPKFLEHDDIFERVLRLFDGAVGQGIEEERRNKLTQEAQQRIDNKIPPGYLDKDKDGDRGYGDFFIWHEILEKAKEEKKDIIFVTSDGKEDWWEKHSGQTVGPRMELLKEAMEHSGQRVLIYKTERFVSLSAEYAGREVDEEIVEDILAVSQSRSGPTVELQSQNIIESSETVNRGKLLVKLLRNVYRFTCSGQLNPIMSEPPRVRVELVGAPEGLPRIKLGAGAGTDFDFNAHIKSIAYGELLPTGTYCFEYTASCSPSSLDSNE